ncbi:MAG: GNAT family N-acetyltransferase [Bryobacterales bacterium]|nr:GNAT family N-acetyltransferase [Bryobacterales bacterium]
MKRPQTSKSDPLTAISIRQKPAEVEAYVEAVQTSADSERQALGFFPPSAYEDAAHQGKLWVAVVKTDRGEEYAGHLYFGGGFPRLRIFQIAVKEAWRRHGIGSILLSRLVKEAESWNCLSISARVADDLTANAFWDHHRFEIVDTRPGGTTSNRNILVRQRQLNTPTLFDMLDSAQSPTDHDLRLAERLYEKSPVYAFDINVLMDLIKKRPGAKDVQKIISASLANSIRLFVAPEFIAELTTAGREQEDDPILEFAETLPQFPNLPDPELKRLTLELGKLVFPVRARQKRLKTRDHSDLRHLATAAYNHAAGFITSDKAILKRQAVLLHKFSVNVVGVSEFAEWLVPPEWIDREHLAHNYLGESSIEAVEVREEDRGQNEAFLTSIHVPMEEQQNALAEGHSGSPRRRLAVRVDARTIAYASWSAPQKVTPKVDVFVYVDESVSDAEPSLDCLFSALINDSCSFGTVELRILSHVSNSVDAVVTRLGFRRAVAQGSKNQGSFHKVCLGRVLREENWNEISSSLAQRVQLELPRILPDFHGANTVVTVISPRGTALSIPLHEFEELVGPALLLLNNRPGAIIPIRAEYAERLLGTSDQRALFCYEARLLSTRTYYSQIATLPVLRQGTILCFYESKKGGGRGLLIACARSVENWIGVPEMEADSVRRGGVLGGNESDVIAGKDRCCITRFDMVMKFKNPVTLDRLRELGCDDGSSFVTSKRISHQQLISLIDEGQPYV